MSTLYNLLFAWKCSSTHHKLAMDALRHLRGDQAVLWQNLFLKNIELYLDGSKAPDNKFKDFRNHVLHVQENYWGGAAETACIWYQRTLECLRARDWQKAVYCAGVLSHYYTDPLQPLHTAQSEAEGPIHRAAEWSFAQSYGIFQQLLQNELGGYPDLEIPPGPGWLTQMVREGAEAARPAYETILQRYDLERGRINPSEGLDEELRLTVALLVGQAVIGFSRILERLFVEAAVEPPMVSVRLEEFLTRLTIPIFWVVRKIEDIQEQGRIAAIYDEWKKTGQVVENLPDDDRLVRELHAREVLGVVPQEPRPKSTAAPEPVASPLKPGPQPEAEQPAAPDEPEPESPPVPANARRTNQTEPKPSLDEGGADRQWKFHLEKTRPVDAAPSIGPKTAKRLERIGVFTVADLLEQDPETAATVLNVRHITADSIRDWQHQAILACRIPRLRGHDAQLLVASGITSPEDLAGREPAELLERITPVATSEEGQRILRSSPPPDVEEIARWIEWAGHARSLKAA